MTRKQIVLSLIGIVLACTTARAAGDAAQAAGAGTADKVKAVVDQSLTTYRELKTYQGKCTSSWVMKMTDDDEGGGQTHTETATLTFSSPNRFRDEAKSLIICCDGSTLWFYDPKTHQYADSPLKGEVDLAAEFEDKGLMGRSPDLVEKVLIERSKSLRELLPVVTSWDGVEEEVRDSQSVLRVTGKLACEQMPSDKPLLFTAWLGAKDHLVREIVVDATESYREMMAQQQAGEEDEENDAEDAKKAEEPKPQVEKAMWSLKFEDIRVNEAVDEAQFTFKPQEADKKVATFIRRQPGGAEQLKLIGQAAPDFSGKALDGEAISLSSLRGKVVLLDFWATWCGPCVQAIPHVQKLSQQFAGKAVAVVGVNRDGEGAEKKVQRFLEKKGITIRQFMDTDGETAEKYKVTGIPCTVLLDTNGVIQAIHTGFGSGLEEELGENIEKLLAGKQVFDPEEIKKQIASAESEGDEEGVVNEGESEEASEQAGAGASNVVLATVEPYQLVPAAAKSVGGVSCYNARELDLNGDGRPETIFADWEGSLRIVSADGERVERIRFKGADSRSSIGSFEPVIGSEGTNWLVSFARWGGGGNRQSARAAFYSPAGERLWTYTPELGRGYSSEIRVTAKDLDGDGSPECVLGINAYKTQRMGGNSYRWTNQRAYLAVLDVKGTVKSLSRAGRQIEYVRAVAPAAKGEKGTIWAIGGGEMRRYSYDPTAQPPPEPEAKPTAPEK